MRINLSLSRKQVEWLLLCLYLLLALSYIVARALFTPLASEFLEKIHQQSESHPRIAQALLGSSPAGVPLRVFRSSVFKVLVKAEIFLFATATFLILFSIKEETQENTKKMLLLIVLNGTLVRLMMAYVFTGNYDMECWQTIAGIVSAGGNVYAETTVYTYSPVWSLVLKFLETVRQHWPVLPFHFVVKAFLTTVDMLILVILLRIARLRNFSLVLAATFFYLNPVSYLLTGFHGQFDNLALLFVFLGIWAYLKLQNRPLGGKTLLWLFATVGVIVKHIIFYELILCMNFVTKHRAFKAMLLFSSAVLFVMLLLPYWSDGKKNILEGVFMNQARIGIYGVTSLFTFAPLRHLFILSFCVWAFFLKDPDIIRQNLGGSLFFLVFTTGIGIQYFVLPIALGALRPSKGFLIYTLVGGAFILGSDLNVNLPWFNLLRYNVVWIAAIFWFVTEQYQVSFTLKGKDKIGEFSR